MKTPNKREKIMTIKNKRRVTMRRKKKNTNTNTIIIAIIIIIITLRKIIKLIQITQSFSFYPRINLKPKRIQIFTSLPTPSTLNKPLGTHFSPSHRLAWQVIPIVAGVLSRPQTVVAPTLITPYPGKPVGSQSSPFTFVYFGKG